jgi:hypothetical protein
MVAVETSESRGQSERENGDQEMTIREASRLATMN